MRREREARRIYNEMLRKPNESGWFHRPGGSTANWAFFPESLQHLKHRYLDIMHYGTRGVHYAMSCDELIDMIEEYGIEHAPTLDLPDLTVPTDAPTPPVITPDASVTAPAASVSASAAATVMAPAAAATARVSLSPGQEATAFVEQGNDDDDDEETVQSLVPAAVKLEYIDADFMETDEDDHDVIRIQEDETVNAATANNDNVMQELKEEETGAIQQQEQQQHMSAMELTARLRELRNRMENVERTTILTAEEKKAEYKFLQDKYNAVLQGRL